MQPSRFLRPIVVATLLVLVAAAPAAPTVPAARAAEVLVGAGDIAVCGSSADEATAALVATIPGTVFTTGDNVYPSGTASDFASCYHPSWGQLRGRTRPSPGNHEYQTTNASGYYGYFGWRAGPDQRGYYTYRRGSWRIYSLNSERIDAAQIAWLKADLARRTERCTLAYWHHPRFSSGSHGNTDAVRGLWRALYRAGAEVVVTGHDHDYERFAKMRGDGSRSRHGLRQFVVGTGGAALRPFATVQRHSVVRNAEDHGVLRLVLRDRSYRWQFIAVDGTVKDSGVGRCHNRP